MEPKLIFWGLSLVNMICILILGFWGWLCIRAGDVEGHLRAMYRAGALIGLFLLAYGTKVLWLGREDLATWSVSRLAMLRLHEVFVTGMLLAGLGARIWVRRRESGAWPSVSPRHAVAGRTALIAGLLALATAFMVFAGMFSAASEVENRQAQAEWSTQPSADSPTLPAPTSDPSPGSP